MLQLRPEDQVLGYGELGNFSVAGFEMVLNRFNMTFSHFLYLFKKIYRERIICGWGEGVPHHLKIGKFWIF